ncbi:amidase [Brevibacterium sp. 5221]|uniref:Amidase n=1 Tax=Brevibacterium rongguiense TaxID=2695267 RepID=A0A6N9H8Z8_9MICO|nr:amidase [Brevibacterium rongguiense]MYM20445.1 amidase [Brevibacterium rongguiense]
MTTEPTGPADEHNAYVTRLHRRGTTEPGSGSAARSGGSRPLAGIPIAVKDVIDVAGVSATFGSRVPVRPASAERSAPLVRALERAGATVIATTNCQEFSYGILGDESAHGRSINPIDPALVTGGSSMGSAIAVATGDVPLSIGTDTAGSVRVPAACAGVIGFKPTFGSLPVEGIFPLAPTFDTPGLFARDTEVLETAFEAARTAAATEDTSTRASAGEDAGSGPTTIDLSLLDGPLRAETPHGAAVATLVDAAVRELPELSPAPGTGLGLEQLIGKPAAAVYSVVRRYEAYRIHRPYLAEYAHLYQPGVLRKIRAGEGIAPGEYEQHLRMLADLRRRALAQTRNAQLILTPAIRGDVPTWDAVTQTTADDFVAYSMPFNVLGWPAIVIPTPVIAPSGVPVALQLVGKPGADLQVLRTAGRLLAALRAV